MVDTAASYGVAAGPRTGYPGCWVAAETEPTRGSSGRSGFGSRRA